mgnify:CR=1
MDITDSRTMAGILTRDGFLKWAEGESLTRWDFKPQWEYLWPAFVEAAIAAAEKEE